MHGSGEPPGDALQQIDGLLDRGMSVQAFRLAEALGGPLAWRSAPACAVGSRLLHHAGAPRGAALLALRAYRADRSDPRAVFVRASWVRDTAGPHAALELLASFPVDAAPAAAQSDLRLLRAVVLGELRDFEAAEYELVRAELLAQGDPWAAVVRCGLLEDQDRMEEALEVVQAALAGRPRYRPAVQAAAHLLVELGQVDAAAELLLDAAGALESGAIAAQLGQLELVRRRPREAWEWTIRAAQRFPFLEQDTLRSLVAACSEAACELGDYDTAAALARSAGAPALLRLAERIEARPERRRVRLDVPFVRQAHRTCAPATLTSLCRYFGRPAEHLAIAEQICFDGTSGASERQWAEQQGLVAREFTVTWSAALALLDRGLPFAMSTQDVHSAHEQAVAGYDLATGSFAVRDPSRAKLALFDIEALLRVHAWNGPRGMVLAPPELADRLDGVELPDAPLYDLLYAMERALRAHDRPAAAAALAELQRRAPEHHLAAHAARALAGYDDDVAGVLAAVERQLAQHPGVAALEVARLACLAGLGRRDERRARLEALVEERAHPIFWLLLAEVLLEGRELERAEPLLRRMMAIAPTESRSYRGLARVRAAQARWDEARGLLRLAACLDSHESDGAWLYFTACQQTGARAEALAFLRDRFERLGRRFRAPAQALYQALDVCDRTAEGLEVLERAAAWRPDDGELLLDAAWAFATVGRRERARALLAQAEGCSHAAAWQTVAARLDVLDGSLAAARDRHAQVLAEQPLALQTYRELAPLDAALGGPAAALARIDAAAARFPHHAGVARLRVEWTPDEGEAGVEVVRALLRAAPGEVEAHGELALRLGRRGRHEEAAAALAQAQSLAPHAAQPRVIAAQLALWRQEPELAAAALRAAVSADVDAPGAIVALVGQAKDADEARAALGHARGELRRQVSDGRGISAYRRIAWGREPPEDTLALLEEARAVRPDLLASWTESIRQRTAMAEHDAAREVAEEAVRRFPMQVDAHMARAEALGAAGQGEAQIEALEAAVALAPTESAPALALASALTAAGRTRAAIELLERALRGDPLVADFGLALADALWSAGEREAALERLIAALERDPADAARWGQLAIWAELLDAQEKVVAAARRFVESRPQSGWARLGLALVLPDAATEEKLARLDEALDRDPRLLDACDERARLLALAGRFEEALAACVPRVAVGTTPLTLRGRAAWVRHRMGEPARALREMAALVAEAPDYEFGWRHVVSWAGESEEFAQAREACAALHRLCPDDAAVTSMLYKLRLQAGDLEGASAALEALRRHGEDDEYRSAALRLALARGPREGMATLERYAEDPEVALVELLQGAELLRTHAGDEALGDWLERMLGKPGVTPAFGYVWGRYRSLGPLAALTAPWRVRALRASGALGIEARAGHVERLGWEGRGLALMWFVWQERTLLRSDLRLWVSVGSAFLELGWDGRARAWFADWERRAGLEPWMLTYVVTALRSAGKDAEARRAGQRALERPPDDSTPRHRLWMALDAARAGAAEAAKQALADVPEPDEVEPLDCWLYYRCRSLLVLQDPALPEAERRALATRLIDASEGRALGCFRKLVVRLRGELLRWTPPQG